MPKTYIRLVLAILFLAGASVAQSSSVTDLIAYIDKSWDTLSRSMNDCETVVDKRVPEHSVLYLPADFPPSERETNLGTRCKIKIDHLPQRIRSLGSFNPSTLQHQGVLYLPNPYVVPGGFLNEMYGWDSYFIIRGLLRSGRVKMAQGIVENFFFEIDHYGAILNANRTYFLTRSQPPFLSSMVLAVSDSLPNERAKHDWLGKAYPYLERDYQLWTSGEHLAGTTGLSRYFDYGQGPVPEISEMRDPYYRDVFTHLQASPGRGEYLKEQNADRSATTGPAFSFEACEQDEVGCAKSPMLRFTSDYYKGDRALRESGFDITFRFAPFGAETHHFAPVCLNSLLYKAEADMAKIAALLARPDDSKKWTKLAENRKALVDRYLWDAKMGMYFDYNFQKQKLSEYEYITTFYPLWVGMASTQQAAGVIAHVSRFERKGGLLTSPYVTGVQWDAPYGWAPEQLVAVEGIARYGATTVANRLAQEWVDTVNSNFRREGTIREKYDVEAQSSETNITAGYKQNVVGFGWTNAVTLEFIHRLGLDTAAQSAAATR